MKFIGVGNEQWGADYIERYKVFEKAIHAKYPDIKIISGSGPSPDGEFFDYGWKELKKLNAQIVDEHYYNSPEWFLKNADRYDKYDRRGPKVFAGEYAAQSVGVVKPDNKNNWLTALSEAAFMTGLERNADVVTMTSYAPLFAHVDGWQWTPDLIWFNNLKSYATPNYYVQKLFSNNKGTDLIKISENGKPLKGEIILCIGSS
jgi:alpha-N-arabinofuranosidase